MVQRLMVHSSVTTTEIYTNIDLKRVKDDFPTLTYVIPKLGMVDTPCVLDITTSHTKQEKKVAKTTPITLS